MNPQFWWYVARASGMVAAVALVLTLIWGLLITTKLIDRRGLPAWLTDLHRYLGGLSVVFIGVHLVALVADNYLVFSWADLFVPFASSWKAGPVAWGIGAFWGLIVVEGTSLAQRHMPRPLWRGVHYASYPVAVMTALHAAQAGTDAGNPVFQVVSISLIVVLSALTIFRIVHTPPKRASAARSGRIPAGLARSGAASAPEAASAPSAPAGPPLGPPDVAAPVGPPVGPPVAPLATAPATTPATAPVGPDAPTAPTPEVPTLQSVASNHARTLR